MLAMMYMVDIGESEAVHELRLDKRGTLDSLLKQVYDHYKEREQKAVRLGHLKIFTDLSAREYAEYNFVRKPYEGTLIRGGDEEAVLVFNEENAKRLMDDYEFNRN